MKCRHIFKDNEKDPIIVWFGSYGKTTEGAESQRINLNSNEILIGKSLCENQEFKIILSNSNSLQIQFCKNNEVIQSVSISEIKDNNIINGKLCSGSSAEINKIKIVSFDALIETENNYIIFKEYRKSKMWKDDAERKKLKDNNETELLSYSENSENVKDSLLQRLSLLKGELWYNINIGLPLTDKVRSKGIYDSIILNIISEHPEVTSVISFKSELKSFSDKSDERYNINKMNEKYYHFDFIVSTIYGENLKISN